MKREKYEIYLNNDKYYKVVGIYTKHEPLLTALQENIRYLIKQTEAAGLFDQDERSMRNLNRELYTFNCFFAFKQVLLKTDYNSDAAKREMIEICRNYYRNNKKELMNIDEFERTYQSQDAIYWYTKQTFLYRLVNKALRTEDYEAMLVLRFFILDLCESLRQNYEELKQHSQIVISYRGLKLTPQEIYNLKQNVDETIATNGFLSTSRSKDVAYAFAKKGTKRSNVETVMLEIDVDMSKVTVILADIAQYSDYPEEQEILFDSGASFTINSVLYDMIEKIWVVKLTAKAEESWISDIQTCLNEYSSERDMNILLGKLLYRMEKYSVCRKYFKNLINIYGNEEHEKLAKIYDYIGRSSHWLEDRDEAIVNCEKAFEYYVFINRLEDAAMITSLIATQYNIKDDKVNGRLYLMKSHDMWKETPTYYSENPHCGIGRIMVLFGSFEEDHLIIRDYFLKALKIYENPSNTCEHSNHDEEIAIVCQVIASIYNEDNDYDKAFDYIMKSINILGKKMVSAQTRKYYVECLNLLWSICDKTHNDLWSTYKNQFDQLFDIELVQLDPDLKDLFDSTIDLRRTHLDTRDADSRVSAEFLQHSLKLLKFLLKSDPKNYEKIIQAHMDIGLAYEKTKDYDWSCQHYEKALEMCQTYAPNNSKQISTIFKHLSDISLDRKNFDHAINLRMKSLSVNEKTYHLTEKENEAQCYYDIGQKFLSTDPDKVLEFIQKSLEIRQQILPEHHVNIAFCHHDIGVAYEKKDMFDAALEHYEKAIEIYEKHLFDKEEYQFNVKKAYSRCCSNIAKIYCHQRKYDNAFTYRMKTSSIDEKYCDLSEKEKEAQCYFDIAKELYGTDPNKELEFTVKSLQIRQEILPRDHITIGFCYHEIGAVYEKKVILDIALEHYKKAIEIYEKHLFDKEEYQFNVKKCNDICHTNVCIIYCRQRKYDDAFVYRMKALCVDDKKCHLTEKEKEAHCYFDIGNELCCTDPDKALEFTLKSLDIRQQVLPRDHIIIGFCHHNVGASYEKKCIFDTAVEHYKKAIEIYKKHLLDEEEYEFNVLQLYGQCHNGLAICYASIEKGKNVNAIDYTLKALQIFQQYSPENKIDVARCYWNYGYISWMKGQYDEAIEQLYKSLDIVLYQNTIDVGRSYHLLGVCYYEKFAYQQALSFFERALKNYEQFLRNLNDENAGLLLYYTSLCLFKLNNYNQALEYAIKSNQVRDEIFPSIHVQRAASHSILPLIYAKLQQKEKSNQHRIEALEISKQLISKNEKVTNIGSIFENIGELYKNRNNLRQARKYYKKALQYTKQEKVDDHPDIERIQKIIGSLSTN
ncbi:unnamed protein product [Rotaria sp. Silwood1]|nr:unnamed protein product [Rotaria sp. Silwood1]